MYKYLLFCLMSFSLMAQSDTPVLKYYVNDYTGTISSSDFAELNAKLKAFDDSTSTQVVFLMVETLDGMSIEDYSIRIANQNKIGTSKNKNGVLFVVAKEDRKMRIEVGRGLEGPLPDALARRIIDNEVKPYFKKNKYPEGIRAGLESILLAVKGEYKDKNGDGEEVIGIIAFIIIIIVMFVIRGGMGGGGRGRRVGNMIFWGGMSSGWGSRTGGFGSGGSGFGGFSGGGGSFGGGGASGSW